MFAKTIFAFGEKCSNFSYFQNELIYHNLNSNHYFVSQYMLSSGAWHCFRGNSGMISCSKYLQKKFTIYFLNFCSNFCFYKRPCPPPSKNISKIIPTKKKQQNHYAPNSTNVRQNIWVNCYRPIILANYGKKINQNCKNSSLNAKNALK